jgi:uncharacterized damage-inducible protein DinB
MKSLLRLSTLLLTIAFATLPSSEQANGSPKPPLSPSQALLENWNDVGRKLTAMAKDFPEDKYDFKPNPAQRSFAEQLLHAANANYFFIKPATGQKPPAAEDPKRSQYKTKAEVVAFVQKSFSDGAAVIQSKGDSGLNELLVDPFQNQEIRLGDMAWSLLEHSGEHYGQLVVYYRVAGLVPPESRPRK